MMALQAIVAKRQVCDFTEIDMNIDHDVDRAILCDKEHLNPFFGVKNVLKVPFSCQNYLNSIYLSPLTNDSPVMPKAFVEWN